MVFVILYVMSNKGPPLGQGKYISIHMTSTTEDNNLKITVHFVTIGTYYTIVIMYRCIGTVQYTYIIRRKYNIL